MCSVQADQGKVRTLAIGTFIFSTDQLLELCSQHRVSAQEVSALSRINTEKGSDRLGTHRGQSSVLFLFSPNVRVVDSVLHTRLGCGSVPSSGPFRGTLLSRPWSCNHHRVSTVPWDMASRPEVSASVHCVLGEWP